MKIAPERGYFVGNECSGDPVPGRLGFRGAVVPSLGILIQNPSAASGSGSAFLRSCQLMSGLA